MKEHLNDYKERIKEEMLRQMEEMDKSLENNPELLHIQPRDGIDEEIFAQVRKLEGESEERTNSSLNAEDQEALELGRKIQEKRRRKERLGSLLMVTPRRRRLIAAMVVVVMFAGLGTVGVGGPDKIISTVTREVGNRKMQNHTSSKSDYKRLPSDEEQEIYEEIEGKLGIKPVYWVWNDKKAKFKKAYISEEMGLAQLIFEYSGKNIFYTINIGLGESAYGNDTEDSVQHEYEYRVSDVIVTIVQYEVDVDNLPKYEARFDYQGVSYQLIAVMEKEEFEENLNLLFFP